MYKWHATKKWHIGIIVMQLGRFLTRECLLGYKQQNYLNNHYLQYMEEKKRTKYQLILVVKSIKELEKVEAYKTKKS